MDGNTIDLDPKTAEAMRQQKVFERAMASLERKKKQKEGEGLAVMLAVDTFKDATEEGKFLARMTNFAKVFLVFFLGAVINYFFWAFVMNG